MAIKWVTSSFRRLTSIRTTWLLVLLAAVAAAFWQCNGDKPVAFVPPFEIISFIDSVFPADGAIDVPLGSCVRIAFLRQMDTATMAPRKFHFDVDNTYSLSRDSLKVVMCASGGLNYGAEYHVVIDSGIADTFGNVMTTPYSFSFRTETGDAFISAISPANGQTDVPLDADIEVRFTRGMNTATIIPANFVISNGVTGTMAYTDRRLVFTPGDSLESNHTYTVTLKAAIADSTGATLGQDYSWTFTTIKVGNGYIQSIFPVDEAIEVPINANPYIQFSVAIDPASLTPEDFTVSGGVAGVVSVAGSYTSSVNFNPTADLQYGTSYTVAFHGDVAGTAGQAIHIDRTWSFTTEDTVPPQVVSVFPVDEAVGVPNKISVSITFDKNINPASIAAGEFYIAGHASDYDRVSVSGTTVTLDPNNEPPCSQKVTAVFDGDVSDIYGHSGHINHTWEFTTYSAFDTASCYPGPGEGCIPSDSPIRLAFSRILDSTTVTAANLIYEEHNGPSLSGSLSCHDSIVEFQPDVPFTPLKNYRITVLTGIKDAYGDNFPVPRSWLFSAKGENLLPLAVGNTWFYQVKQAIYPITSFEGAYIDSIAIVGDTTIGGRQFFVDQHGRRYHCENDSIETTFQVEYPFTPYRFENSSCDRVGVTIETDSATYRCQPFVVSDIAGYRNYTQGYNFAPGIGLVRYDREFWGGVAVEPHQYTSWRLISYELH
ncbi:MAG: Ig-like domain-containing protein [candidate division Zixibacteria bacterium]|nr:Ig-like domain-containing protein [candidate division Zixibacteria bacterium]